MRNLLPTIVRRSRAGWLLPLLLLLGTGQAWGQALTGTKNIPGDYATLTAAITALNANGVGSGGVTFNFVNSGYTETFSSPTAGRITLNSTSTNPTAPTSGTNPIVFQYTGGGTRPKITGGVGTSATADAIISVVGTDNISFVNIDVADNTANTTATTQMEFGYALFHASATDGSQYVSISGSTITLNKTNTATVGIRSAATDATLTALAATNATGANSFASFNGNTVANAFIGISVSGTSATYPDTGDVIGSTTGNTLNNLGGSNTSVYGIRGDYVSNIKVENNAITIPTGTTSNTVYGIGLGATAATGIAGTVLVNNNTIGITTTTSSTVWGIAQLGNSAVTASTITNNKIQNCAITSTGAVYAIQEASTAASTVIITGNTVGGSSTTANTLGGSSSTAANYSIAIYRSGASVAASGTVNVSSNTVSYNTFSSNTSISQYSAGILEATATSTAVITLSSNTVSNNTAPTLGYFYALYRAGAAAASTTANSNTVQSNTVSGSGTYFAGLYITSQTTTSTTLTANSNQILSNQLTAGGATISYCMRLGTTGTLSSASNTISNNTAAVAASTSAATFYSYYNASAASSETFSGNTIIGQAITGGSANTTAGQLLYGIYCSAAATTRNLTSNTVSGLAIGASGTSITGTVYGVYQASGTTVNITQNKIYGLTAYGTAGIADGIYVSSGSTINAANNLVGGILAPASTSATAVAGISVNNTTAANTINLYYNTIYLTGSMTAAGNSAGIYTSTTPTLTMINNIVVNAIAPNGAGISAAYQRSTTTLGTYGANSNNNLFYTIGSPTSAQPIYYDGTTTYNTLVAYKALVASRDAASVTELPPFASTTGTATNYLHIATGTATQVESGGNATNVSPAVPNDYDGDIRYGISGYSGTGTAPDIGADEGNFTPSDLTPPTITYTTQPTNTTSTADQTVVATITDASGISTSYPPRLYYTKNNGTYAFVTAASVSGSSYTFTLPASSLSLVGGDVVQYYVAAQDAAATPNGTTNPTGSTSTNPPGTGFTGTPASYTIQITFSGTVNVGSGQTYTSLTGTTGIFNAFNNNLLSGNVVVNITSDLTETGAVALNQYATGATVTIQSSTTTVRNIIGGYASSGTASLNGLIRFNGASNVTISGGSANSNLATATRYLRFRNTGTAPVLLFFNGASNDNVNNTIVEGGVAAGSIALDGTATANSGNTFAYNDIRDRTDITTTTTTIPTYAFYATGTNSTVTVKGNTVRNFANEGIIQNGIGNNWIIGSANVATDGNLIYQETARANTLYNIDVEGGNSATIGYNSVYQTTGTVAGWYGIYVTGGGSSHVISNNTLGGAAADGTGTLTSSGGFQGIYLVSLDNTAANAVKVQANKVLNITSTSTSTFSYGIDAFSTSGTGGAAIIGGSTAALGNTVSGLTASYNLAGIYANNAANTNTTSSALTVQYNTVSGIQCTTSSGSSVFLGIYANSVISSTVTLSNNTVTGLTRTGTDARANVYGLTNTGSSNFTINANTVSTIAAGGGNNITAYGILNTTSGAYALTSNTVSGLSSSSPGNGTKYASTTIGIGLEAGTPTASANIVSDISNTTTTGAGSSYAQVAGIDEYTTGAVSITRNRIYNVRTAAPEASSGYVYDGVQGIMIDRTPNSLSVVNNQVSLPTGTGTGYTEGIVDISTGTSNLLYFNSVYIGGTGLSGNVSYGYVDYNTSTTTLRDNVFVNTRTTGTNYAIGNYSGAALPSDYNDLYSATSSTLGDNGGTAVTFAGWQATTGTPDTHSKNVNVRFVDATNGNLAPDPSTNCQLDGTGVAISGITTDYNQTTRSSPPDLGSVEFTYTPAMAGFASTTAQCGATTLTVNSAGGNGPFVINYSIGGVAQTAITGASASQTISIPAQTSAKNVVLTSVTDSYGCALNIPVSTSTVTVSPSPTATFNSSNASSVCYGSSSTLTGTLTGTAPFTGTYTVNGGTAQTLSISGNTFSINTGNLTANTTFAIASLSDANCTAAAASLPSTTVNASTTSTWNGSADTNWFNQANWTSCVPTSNIDAVIPGGLTTYPVLSTTATAEVKSLTLNSGGSLTETAGTLNIYGALNNGGTTAFTGGTVGFMGSTQAIPAMTFYNLALGGNATKSLGGAVAVANNLDLTNGMLTLGTYSLTMSDGTGTITGAGSSHFVVINDAGKLGFAAVGGANRSAATYPIGASATTYNPVTLANSGTSNTYYLSLKNSVDNVPAGLSGNYVNRQWDVTASGPGSNVTMTVTWNPADENNGSFNHGSCGIAHYIGTGWELPGSQFAAATANNDGTYSRTRTGLTSFSPFAVEDSSYPLPVELTAFTAQRQGSDARLDWTTASERQNQGFEVQVSTDGTSFRQLGFVAGAGSSVTERRYSFPDKEAGKAGLRYYRLQQLDYDGHTAFSAVRTVDFGAATAASLSAVPNPFGQQLSLRVTANLPVTGATLTLTDMLGRVVYRQALSLPAGSSEVELSEATRNLPTGMYLVQLPLDGQLRTVKVTKE